VYGTLNTPKQMIPTLKSENYLARLTKKNPRLKTLRIEMQLVLSQKG
jgi:hypothetical protein